MTDDERRLRAELGAHSRWGREPNRTAATAPAREGFRRKLEREVDPDGTLPPELRANMVEHRRQEHMKRMALAASRARTARARERKKGGDEAVA